MPGNENPFFTIDATTHAVKGTNDLLGLASMMPGKYSTDPITNLTEILKWDVPYLADANIGAQDILDKYAGSDKQFQQSEIDAAATQLRADIRTINQELYPNNDGDWGQMLNGEDWGKVVCNEQGSCSVALKPDP